MITKFPPEVLEFFKKHAAAGGKKGGKRSLETMTAEARSERARKAGLNSGAARKKAAAIKKRKGTKT